MPIFDLGVTVTTKSDRAASDAADATAIVATELGDFAVDLAHAALPELSRGYGELVSRFMGDADLLARVATHGPAAVLDSDDPALAALRKGSKELVTGAERRAEALMRERVRERFPAHAIVGEELGRTAGNDWLWVFDPVDGTSAMIRAALAHAAEAVSRGAQMPGAKTDAAGGGAAAGGEPAFGVTIAVVHGDRAVVGVIGELRPDADRLALHRVWLGVDGQPTRMGNDVVPPVTDDGTLATAVLACTVPEIMFSSATTWAGFQALRDATATLVRDQNCIGFARLLGGGVDVVVERDLTLPDAAALVPVLLGAGVVVTDHDGGPVRFDPAARDGEYLLLAAAPARHTAALAVLRHGVADAANDFPDRAGSHDGYARKFADEQSPVQDIVRLCRPDIYAMKPYSSARTEGGQNATIYLDANENPYPPYPGTPDLEGLNRYPEPQPSALLDRFAELYGVPTESLFLSRGADEAIDLLVRAFCTTGTDGILIAPPTFVMYETAAQIQGAAVHRVPLLAGDRFDLDVDGMLAAVAANPTIKLVFVCSPNNPTANLLRREDVLHLATELRGRALLVVDELYVDYSGSPSLSRELPAHPNLVVLRSMSKEYSLAGERMGVTVAHPEVIGILGRIMAPYSLTVSAVRIVARALTDEGIAYGRDNIRRILAERERVASELSRLASVRHVFPSDANFVLLRVVEPRQLCKLMESNGIMVRDRSGVVRDAVRISIGTPTENDEMLRVFVEHSQNVGG